MKKKNSPSLATEIYNTLKGRILGLNYRPGEILLIQQIVNELNFSRTPVKEALVRLVSDGYLEIYDNRYFRVKELSVTALVEIFEVRKAIECVALEELAENITPKQIAQFEKNLDANDLAEKNHDGLQILACDEQFHLLLLGFHGNEMMESMFLQANERIRPIRYMTQVQQHVYAIGEEHRRVVEALKAHDATLACQCMADHLERVKSDMVNLLQKRDYPFIANSITYKNNIIK